jgi:prevent-host-death family protein
MKLQNIAPITELKRDAAGLIERATEERTPIVITQNGRATAVLIDVRSYEEERNAFAMLKLLVQSEREIRDGRGLSLPEHRKRVRRSLQRK